MATIIPPTNLELAWIAGFMDGEGCITVNRQVTSRSNGLGYNCHFKPVVSITNTNKEVLEWILSKFNSGAVKSTYTYNPKYKACWAWRPTTVGIHKVLDSLLPFLKVKKPQAQLMLEFLKIRGYPGQMDVSEETFKRRFAIQEQFARLNIRGPNEPDVFCD